MALRTRLLAALFLATCVPVVPASAAGDAAEGERVANRWCVSCHVVGDKPMASDKAPAFAALAADPAKSEGYLKGWISNPHPPMPNFNLTRQTVDDLVAYIRSLGEGKKAIQNK
ncbi:MAG: cytochrome c [Alphaproteobacteria bacterium]|nr:cytochrome c [Alphaproteobacteria bacterium]